MKKTSKYNTINEYISLYPENVQKILKKISAEIQSIAPKAEQVISYQMPTYKLNGKNLVHFAAYEKHIGLYPTPSGISEFKNELKSYKQGKGSVQFPLNEEIPYNLIKKIVQKRIKEIDAT